MRRIIKSVFVLLFASIAADAIAANCTGTTATQVNATTTLGGQRITAVDEDGDGEEWKEDHCPGGNLYKVGSGTTVDPRVLAGTWGPADTIDINYDYGTGGSYTFELWQTTSDYYFCDAAGNKIARITSGPAPIPVGAPCP